MEHTVHLDAKAFIKAINPVYPKKKQGGKDTGDFENGSDEEGEEEWTIDWAAIALDEDTEGDDPVDFNASDLLEKVLTLINQV